MLLEADADINMVNGDNESGLLLAAYYGHTDLVKMLLNKGALTDVGPSKNGLCALGAAAQQGESAASKLLIKHGAPLQGMGIGCCAASKAGAAAEAGECALVLCRIKMSRRSAYKLGRGLPSLCSEARDVQGGRRSPRSRRRR